MRSISFFCSPPPPPVAAIRQSLIPLRKQPLEFAIHLAQPVLEIPPRRFKFAAHRGCLRGIGGGSAVAWPRLAQFIQRLVQFKNLFQQLRRRLLFVLPFPAHPGAGQQILHAAHRISQRAKRIVQLRRTRQRHFPLALARSREIVGMQFPAQLVKAPLELFRIDG